MKHKVKQEWVVGAFALFTIGIVFLSGYRIGNSQKLLADISGANLAGTNGNSSTVGKTFQFKMLIDTDECALNKYGAQGWEIVQMGSILSDNSGGGPFYNANCTTLTHSYMDWVVLQFVTEPPAPTSTT